MRLGDLLTRVTRHKDQEFVGTVVVQLHSDEGPVQLVRSPVLCLGAARTCGQSGDLGGDHASGDRE